jgi:hypothetical protein
MPDANETTFLMESVEFWTDLDLVWLEFHYHIINTVVYSSASRLDMEAKSSLFVVLIGQI